tara:strand:- start:37 stop:243 length:207 start_codon:yes stop_codon:yes gene_type:complete
MTSHEIHTQARIASLSVKIAVLALMMRFETDVTDDWKRMARCRNALCIQRYQLKLSRQQRRNEKRRAG